MYALLFALQSSCEKLQQEQDREDDEPEDDDDAIMAPQRTAPPCPAHSGRSLARGLALDKEACENAVPVKSLRAIKEGEAIPVSAFQFSCHLTP